MNTTAFNTGVTYQITEQAAVYASLSQSFNMQAIPTWVILHKQAALLGAAKVACRDD